MRITVQSEKDSFFWLKVKFYFGEKKIKKCGILGQKSGIPFIFLLIISRRIILHNLMLQFIKFIDFAISDDRTLSLETFTRTIKLWNIFTQIIDTYYYLHPTFQIRKACSSVSQENCKIKYLYAKWRWMKITSFQSNPERSSISLILVTQESQMKRSRG